MCGIIGYIGEEEAAPILFKGLKRLEYRGYDSYGVATLYKENFFVEKDKGEIGKLKELSSPLRGKIGIGHTRWATHGSPSMKNAHPHFDCKSKIAIVHNGVISNFRSLKGNLIEKGHTFKSETDSEVLAHLLEERLKDSYTCDNAFRNALKDVQGTFALLAIFLEEPEKIYCARKDSPLVLGVGKGEMLAGSDISAVLDRTNRVISIDDDHYAVIEKDAFEIRDLPYGARVEGKEVEIGWTPEMAEKSGYKHFMLKEIMEQPQALTNVFNIPPEQFREVVNEIAKNKRTYLIGAGTSLHAALVAQYWFAQNRRAVFVVDSSEFKDLAIVDKDSFVIAITQSGETYDTISAMKYALKRKAKVASIVNVLESTATRLSEKTIMQNSGLEISVCATKTFLGQLGVLGTLAALNFMSESGRQIESILEGFLKRHGKIKEIAEEFFGKGNYFYIGRGITLPVALEGALKFKEITYNHTEGMSGGLFKHGTISLVDEKVIVVALVTSENKRVMESNICEIKARGGKVIAVSCAGSVPFSDEEIVVPDCNWEMSPFLLTPVCQLLAYYTAVKLGRSVDKPRALAKSVTVE